MAYYSVYGGTGEKALTDALTQLRQAESLATDPERKRLERLATREDVLSANQSMLNTAKRQAAKMGAGAGLGLATSNAISSATNAAGKAMSDLKAKQLQQDFTNVLATQEAARGLAGTGASADTAYGNLKLGEAEMAQKPELLRLQNILDMQRAEKQAELEKELLQYKDSLEPGFWERLGSGLLGFGGDVVGKIVSK